MSSEAIHATALPRVDRANGSWHALAVALGGVACLFASSLFLVERPLPALPWAAAFLFLCVYEDVRAARIPNVLTLPGLGVALLVSASSAGAPELAGALAGAGAALALFFVPFACRWLGAGDVKAGMVLGALWGPEIFCQVAWWMVVVGGVMAVALVAATPGGLADLLSRWWTSLRTTVLTRRLAYHPPEPGSPAAAGLPFAVAMALGAAAHQMWGTPWLT